MTKPRVPYIDFARQAKPLREPLHQALDRVLDHGQYILGEEVERFEGAFAAYIGVKHAIGVGSGTDALYLSMKALGIGAGDEVITVPNSYLASASSIALTGARPVFVDVGVDMNLDPERLGESITDRTRAVMPVHLTGRPSAMDEILEIADKHCLPVIEDAAQAVGAMYRGQKVGSLGSFGCFSLHPLKNLNALGDAGIITTDNDRYAGWLRRARNHGHPNRDECDFWSHNMRIDALQAAFLRVKLKMIDSVTERRRAHARMYHAALCDKVTAPDEHDHEKCVYHTYVVQTDRRDELRDHLLAHGIESKIHYPTLIPFLKSASYLEYRRGDFPVAEKQAREVLSLPVAEYLDPQEINQVIDALEGFFR